MIGEYFEKVNKLELMFWIVAEQCLPNWKVVASIFCFHTNNRATTANLWQAGPPHQRHAAAAFYSAKSMHVNLAINEMQHGNSNLARGTGEPNIAGFKNFFNLPHCTQTHSCMFCL